MVVETILDQLGGRKFSVMTGSNNFIADGDTLRMKLAKNVSRANSLEITLDRVSDTYNMRFYKYTAGRVDKRTLAWREDKTEEIRSEAGVYGDMLQKIFKAVTGFDTTL
ncbi:MAG: hypothetical protein RR162_00420 [Oscillospiraceae bacterium]